MIAFFLFLQQRNQKLINPAYLLKFHYIDTQLKYAPHHSVRYFQLQAILQMFQGFENIFSGFQIEPYGVVVLKVGWVAPVGGRNTKMHAACNRSIGVYLTKILLQKRAVVLQAMIAIQSLL